MIRNYHDINQKLDKSVPTNIDLVFIFVDLDFFKAVNDTYGHRAGDQLLINSCRDMDTIIRWGGEEFIVVARNICRDNYTFLVERIRRTVENHPFEIGIKKPIHITYSIGAAVFPFLSNWPEVLSWNSVVELSDVCLYSAKRSARSAWIGIVPTGRATIEDLGPNLAKRLPDLIREGKLEMMTSLPDDAQICWAD